MNGKNWLTLFVLGTLLLLALAGSPAKAAGTLYVKPAATGSCSSWADACTLQTALGTASSGDQIWVAEGTHKPGTLRSDTFQLVSGVEIYGGFPATGTPGWSDRDWAAHPTILSGDIGTLEDSGDNSYHVVTGSGTNATAILDGFTISGGNADWTSSPHHLGGGMYSSSGSPTLTNCTFSGNTAYYGGGVYNHDNSSPTLNNVTFSGNTADYGGGMYNWASSPTLANITFSGNTAVYSGGGMYNSSSSPTLTNCILWGNNSAGSGGHGIHNTGSTLTIAYSDVQGSGGSGAGWPSSLGTDAGGNIDADPLFDGAAGDLRLQLSSPAIDAGDNSAVPSGITTDLGGHPRFTDMATVPDTGSGPPPIVDMGAWEAQPTLIYVDHDAAGDDNGSSWTHAFTDLQDALSSPLDGTEVWVAEGTYYPGTTRSATFQLVSGVAVFGGFAGGESSREERDWNAHETILSGDITGDNSYHVVTGSGTDASAVLDGFTISDGNANGGDPNDRGGGMYNNHGSPALTNITFRHNTATADGGGMSNGAGSPTLTNVTFISNTADGYGGGMNNFPDGNPVLTNVIFSGNTATVGGGGMSNGASSPTLTNVTFSGNTADEYGGGMYNWTSDSTLTNVTFSGNEAFNRGGGLANSSSTPELTNCILWGNTATSGEPQIWNLDSTPAIAYSDVQGGWSGTGNIDVDPRFVRNPDDGGDGWGVGDNDDYGDLRLQLTSPAIDAGDNSAVSSEVTTDLDRHARFVDIPVTADTGNGAAPIVDMGAYEAQLPARVYVDGDATGNNDGSSWTDAYTDLQAAPAWGVEIWVAEGTYYPGTTRSDTFQLENGVEIYGGFAGSETSREERNWAIHETILSGDIGTHEDPSDNVYHVFYHPDGTNLDATAVLDGFTITGGNANGVSWPNWDGGGMYNSGSSPTLTNCTFRENLGKHGSGLYNNASSSPLLTNCIFAENQANVYGGGMYNYASSPVLTHCTFSGNTAPSGGGMYNDANSRPVLKNCILWGNTATNGEQIYNEPSSTPNITYSDIQASGGSGAGWDIGLGTDGGGNLDADPLFVDAASGDLHLRLDSPAIDAGDNSAVPAGVTTDLDGNPRIGNGRVDMGAYEFQYPALPPNPIYVDGAATGARDGSDWPNALTRLDFALDWVAASGASGVEIWVAKGIYRPTVGADRGATFQLVSGVAVYGGFGGTETIRDQRDWAANETILGGDIGTLEDNSDNSYHVVTGTGTDATAVLDGFTISGGNAWGAPANRGGGMYNISGSPSLTNLTFSGNTADLGGGMFNFGENPTLTNVTFSGNTADEGGGMCNAYSSPTLTNVTFSGNAASDGGGGMYNGASNPTLTNCILWGNTATYGEQIYNDPSSTPNITYSDIQASGGSASWDTGLGTDGGGNIDADPLFFDAASGDLRLLACSPAIDAGDNDAPGLSGILTDLDGHPRFVDFPLRADTGGGTGDIVDMGAYEVQLDQLPAAVFVDADATGAGNGGSWAEAFTDLQDALSCASGGGEIWVAEGTYKPGTDRTHTFQLVSGVEIYGGFDPSLGATDFEDRDWLNHETILSGDIGALGNSDNSYHVVTGSGTDASAVLDGFTISGGNANGSDPENRGGGMYNDSGSPTLANVTFSSNTAENGGGMSNGSSSPQLTDVTFSGNTASGGDGGGIHNYPDSSPALSNVIFSGNTATVNGGGMSNGASNPTLTNVTFSGNTAQYGGGMYNQLNSNPTLTNVTFSGNTVSVEGGGMYDYNSNPTLTNVTFSANTATVDGGGMYNYDNSIPTLTNVIFSGNTAYDGGGMYNDSSNPTLTSVTFSGNTAYDQGGGMYNYNSSATLTNCILWGNLPSQIQNNTSSPAISYSDIQNSDGSGAGWDTGLGTDGGGNLDANPLFADAAAGDLHLGLESSAIDAGDNNAVPAGVTTDLDGNPRIENGRVDMGAYEFQYPPLPPNPLYVDGAATGDRDGTNWTDALTRLDFALDWVAARGASGVEIWVAKGICRPTVGADRGATFQLVSGVAVYGGFAGTETIRDQRDWAANETILSGDIGTPEDNSDNSYHVVTGSGTDATALLDGFTISDGNADGSAPHDGGGGMYNHSGTPTLTNLTFSGNAADSRGGGMYNWSSDSTLTNITFSGNTAGIGGGMSNGAGSPTLTNVTFSGNTAYDGGGMSGEWDSDSTLTNVTFSGNTAHQRGGGMLSDGIPTLTNVTFIGNTATADGGGMYNSSGSATLTNVTFSGNTADQGGGMYNYNSSATLTNCILWGNLPSQIQNSNSSLAISYCDIQNSDGSGAGWDTGLGTDGGGNIDAAPLFFDAASGDLHLGLDSPAIDAGDNDAVPAGVTTDLDGNPRIGNGRVDMGAYEFQYPPLPPNPLYVDGAATGDRDGSDWPNALTRLDFALDWVAARGASGVEIWVAEGIYRPTVGADRGATFQLVSGVAVYGGFPDTGTRGWSDRNWNTHETILSGDIGTPEDNSDNSYHVVTGSGTDATAVLDGFTISDGNANGSFLDAWGGGMHSHNSSPTLTNVTFSDNTAAGHGGGMYSSSGNPTLTNVTFSDNTAAGHGGGMDNVSSSPTLTNVTFSGNTAEWGGGICNGTYGDPTLTNVTFSGNTASNGGGMYNGSYTDPTLTNVTFSGNTASNGGGMYNQSISSPTLTNVTFSGNTASVEGGGMYNRYSTPTLTNCILWGNLPSQIYNSSSTPDITYSDVEGSGGSSGGNIDADPLFVDAGAGDLLLQFSSPAIDAGDPANCPATDIRGLPRDDLRCDMGAYEVQLSDASTIEKCGLEEGNTYSFGPTLVQVDMTTAGTLDCLTVQRFDQDHPAAPDPVKTGKYWTLTPDGDAGAYSVALTLPHEDLADPCVCRYLDPGWDGSWDGRTTTSVTRSGITSFSDWAVSSGAPTAVTLASFSATATDAGAILLAWETATEVDTLGFHLYRSGSPDGELVHLSETLIPSRSPGSLVGSAYELVDDAILPAFTYYYWLDVVDIHGVATRHGPVPATVAPSMLYRIYLPVVNR